MHSMTSTRSPACSSATTILAMTSLLLLIPTAVTSALPSRHPALRSNVVGTAEFTGEKAAEPTTLKTPDSPGGVVVCPGGYYFSEGPMVCKPCSACPVNQIIRSPCSGLSDTVCGPFFEFDTFNQSPVGTSSRDEEEEEGDEEKAIRGQLEHGLPRSHAPGSIDSLEADDQQSAVSLRIANGQWRTLSYALIAVLSFICCLVVVVGLYVYVILRRAQAQKIVVREPELLAQYPYPDVDPEPRYVDMFVTSRDRIRTSRHSPVYHQIITGYDASEVTTTTTTPLTSSAGDVKTGGVVRGTDEGDRLCVYVNTEALDATDS